MELVTFNKQDDKNPPFNDGTIMDTSLVQSGLTSVIVFIPCEVLPKAKSLAVFTISLAFCGNIKMGKNRSVRIIFESFNLAPFDID